MSESVRAAAGIRRIHFVEPGAPDLHIFSRFRLPRIGSVLLATILREAGYRTRCFCEDIRPLVLSEIADADLVGISTTTSTAPKAYRLAGALRARGVRVFMGGPHVTFLPDEALEHCDWVFRGEADEWITRAVAAVDGRLDPASVRGLSWRDSDGSVHHNERPDFVRDLDALPPPDFGLLPAPSRSGTIPMMTSRGCPYDCSFCSVTPMFGRCYRFKSVGRVLDELRGQDLAGRHVFFYDDHFCANPERTDRLLDALLKAKLDFHWSAQVRADITRNPAMIEKMARAGCTTVYVGMESVNPETLEAYNKRQTVADVERAVRVFHRRGVYVHGMFVLGSDMDTPETVRETARFSLRNRIETAQFMILAPLPGTRHFEDLRREERIVFDDWSLYDAQHVVFRPARMSMHRLQMEVLKATLKFYSKRQALKLLLRFQFYNSVIRAYGRRLAKEWRQRNLTFFSRIKALGAAAAPRSLTAPPLR